MKTRPYSNLERKEMMSGLSSKQKSALDDWAASWLARLGAPQTFEAAVAEKLDSGVPYSQIVDEVARERPDLYEKYRQSR